MDFPLTITDKSAYTYGMDEFKNTLYVILKNHIGTFIQSNNLGTSLDVHSPVLEDVEHTISTTIEQIPNTELVDMNIYSVGRNYDLTLLVRYKDDIVKFNFTYENKV